MKKYLAYSVIVSAVFVSCIIGMLILYANNSEGQVSGIDYGNNIVPWSNIPLDQSLGLKKFNTTEELKSFLLLAQARNNAQSSIMQDSIQRGCPNCGVAMPVPYGALRMAPSANTNGPEMSQSTVAPSLEAGTDYSTTNIQVNNVDEPDFLKNDAKYAYILSQDKLTIIDAYPGDTAKIISKIGLDIQGQSLQNMFLNKDRLVVFYNGNDQRFAIPQYDYMPSPVFTPTTHAIVIDVSDRENPKILKNYEISGNYFNARMIGDYVYLISTSSVDYNNPVPPVVRESAKAILSPPVYYYGIPEPSYNFNTVTSFDIFSDKINSQTYLMGSTGTLYVSTSAIYIAYQQSYPYYLDAKERFSSVIVPLLPEDAQNKIKTIENSGLDPDTQWAQISDVMQGIYNSTSQNDKDQLFNNIQKALQDYNYRIQDTTRTVIEKVAIDNGSLKYVAQGSVPGYLLNQYSMDESDNKLRVATTSQFYNPSNGNWQSNNVLVLDDSLKIVGHLEKIAPNEKIYSARFMGDKLYLVTFRQFDPFFVIDLSSDTPKVLGALKLPGYSGYLHPYDQNHIIGIGREIMQNEPYGVKISLFDVSNVSNPVTVDTIDVGGQTSNSDVLSDPKALLFDKEKNILVIPISEQQYGPPIESDAPTTDLPYSGNWQGFYVYGVDTTTGFTIKGKIEHNNGTDYGYPQGSRSFYINDLLYTVTPSLMKINDLNNLSHEINHIGLDNTGQIIKYMP